MKSGNSKKRFVSRLLLVAFILTMILPQSLIASATSDYRLANDVLAKQIQSATTTSEARVAPLPKPVLKLKDKEYKNGFTYFNLEVTNYQSYPNSMFLASRTKVGIYNAETNAYIYGFVSLSKPSSLNRIWFAISNGKTPPKSVYIKLIDRRTNITYKSNTIVVNEDLPDPVLKLMNTEVKNGFTYYNLEVTNYLSYPDSLFAASPDLPAAGLNTSASRTFVEIYNGETNTYIYGFVALSKASDLNGIWFASATGATPPKSVYIKLIDRRTNTTYKSNTIVVNEELPNPVLKLMNTEVKNGFTYYNLEVTNYQSYPDSLFAASPDLPAAGLNTSASRTFVEIYNGETNAYIYGFVALSKASDLNGIWFASATGATPPKSVYIKLIDRRTNTTYKSNTLVF